MSYINIVENNKEKVIQYLKHNYIKIIIVILFLIIIYIYFHSFYRRIPRYLFKIRNNLKNLKLRPITSCPKLIKNKYKLCDFYISSSSKSYLPCSQYYDYASTEILELSILNGARYVELDIFNKGFCDETIPVVTNGTLKGNWHWTNELSFEDCCETIFNYAFSSIIPNPTDPFFLGLNLHLGYNCKTADKIADILKSFFSEKFLDSRFSYQRTNIAQVDISEFIGKIIILCNSPCKTSNLSEYINYTWSQPFMRSYSHYDIQSLYDPKEVREYNKKNLSRIFPAFTERKTQNYNPRSGWLYGCQFVGMNFSHFDDNMRVHFLKFNKSSFSLKPYQLRYHKDTYKKPTLQTKKVSFAPEQITTPFYSITY
jgi:hypothetical protein